MRSAVCVHLIAFKSVDFKNYTLDILNDESSNWKYCILKIDKTLMIICAIKDMLRACEKVLL